MSIYRRIERLERTQPPGSKGPQPLVVQLTDEQIPGLLNGERSGIPDGYTGPIEWDLSAVSDKGLRQLADAAIQAEEDAEG